MRIQTLLAAVFASLLCVPASAENWKLMGDIEGGVGQYFFQNGAGSVNGYANAELQQMRSFSSVNGLFLNESLNYTGFKQVNELAGGGTLFQQSSDNSVSGTWIHRYEGGYSLKPHVGVHQEMFRETVDEDWGNGLYDFWRYNAGLTWERKTRLGLSVPWTYQVSYDAYYTHYPHFQTLSSQFGAALGAPNPGVHTLDAVSNQFSFRSDFDLPGFITAWGLYSLSLVNYPEQRLVDNNGAYLNMERMDFYQYLNLGGSKRLADWDAGSWGRIRPVAGVSVTFSDLSSNQNNFDTDPAHLKFTDGYFDYSEAHIAPNFSVTFLKPMFTASLGYDFGYRAYGGRQTQNPDGSYTGNLLSQYVEAANLDLSWPLAKDLELKAKGMWSFARANTQFQQTYVYNYKSCSYFVGLGWRF